MSTPATEDGRRGAGCSSLFRREPPGCVVDVDGVAAGTLGVPAGSCVMAARTSAGGTPRSEPIALQTSAMRCQCSTAPSTECPLALHILSQTSSSQASVIMPLDCPSPCPTTGNGEATDCTPRLRPPVANLSPVGALRTFARHRRCPASGARARMDASVPSIFLASPASGAGSEACPGRPLSLRTPPRKGRSATLSPRCMRRRGRRACWLRVDRLVDRLWVAAPCCGGGRRMPRGRLETSDRRGRSATGPGSWPAAEAPCRW